MNLAVTACVIMFIIMLAITICHLLVMVNSIGNKMRAERVVRRLENEIRHQKSLIAKGGNVT